MTENLKERAFSASLWRLLQSGAVEGSTFVVQVVLARLLTPEDFGLIAMIWALIAVMQTFVMSGCGLALVQKQKATHTDECSVFYFQLVVSLVVYVTLWLLAPWVARFYDQPLLVSLIRVTSIFLIVGALGYVQLSLLLKEVDFRTQCRIDVAASVVSGIVGITMAFLGFGVWSLVAQLLSRICIRVSLAWCYSKWRPAWRFGLGSLKGMLSFGSNVLFAQLLETVYQNIHSVVIGKLFTPTDLGLYSRAQRLEALPAQNITSVVAGVAFPVFSQVQEDGTRLRTGLHACLGVLALCTFPTMVGLAIVAKPFVSVVLTEKWLPCVPYLQMLCVVGALYPFYTLLGNVLLSTGRSRLFFWLHLSEKVVAVFAIIITYHWGIKGLICGQIVASLISTALFGGVVGRLVQYPLRSQIAAVCPYLALSVIIGVLVRAARFIPFKSGAWLLIAQVLLCVSCYVLFCHLLRLPAFVLAHDLVRRRFWRIQRGTLAET